MTTTDRPMEGFGESEFERELRRVLQQRALGPAPAALRLSVRTVVTEHVGPGRRMRIALGATGRERPRLRLPSLAVAGMALVFLTGIVALGLFMTQPPRTSDRPSGAPAVVGMTPSSSPVTESSVQPSRPQPAATLLPATPWPVSTSGGIHGKPAINWHYGQITLKATSVLLQAGGRLLRPKPPSLVVGGDHAGATSATLDLRWIVGTREWRLSFDVAADGTNWWVSQITTSNGLPGQEWNFGGPLLTTPIGQTYRGDLDIQSTDGTPPARLMIAGLRLNAFAP
jgi:hypothetical protein